MIVFTSGAIRLNAGANSVARLFNASFGPAAHDRVPSKAINGLRPPRLNGPAAARPDVGCRVAAIAEALTQLASGTPVATARR